MPFPWAPIIGGALSLGGSIYSSLSNRAQSLRNVRDTNAANRELAEYSYGQEREMIREMNEYNTPEEQMKRYRRAGLNPNLIYSQGKPGQQTQIAKYNAPKMDYSGRLPLFGDMPDIISQFQNFELKNAEIDNVQAVAENQKIKNELDKHLLSANKHIGELKLGLSRQEHQRNIEDIELKRLGQELSRKKLTEKDYDLIYKKYRNDWMKRGISNSDNAAFRIMVRLLLNSGVDLLDTNTYTK